MAGDTPYTRTFRLAIDTLGSIENLSTALGTPVAIVELWLAGHSSPPPSMFLRAIDIVANGGLVPRSRARS